MTGASKILTVSYGAFSCTLEGFDDPLASMKVIAEYFRDLAAQDRFFGAAPPTPDPLTLHRLAQDQLQRPVEAEVSENAVRLRPRPDAEFTPQPLPPGPTVPAEVLPTLAAAPTLRDDIRPTPPQPAIAEDAPDPVKAPVALAADQVAASPPNAVASGTDRPELAEGRAPDALSATGANAPQDTPDARPQPVESAPTIPDYPSAWVFDQDDAQEAASKTAFAETEAAAPETPPPASTQAEEADPEANAAPISDTALPTDQPTPPSARDSTPEPPPEPTTEPTTEPAPRPGRARARLIRVRQAEATATARPPVPVAEPDLPPPSPGAQAADLPGEAHNPPQAEGALPPDEEGRKSWDEPTSEAAVSRLMAQTEQEFEGPQTRRRQAAIAQLKAAVAAAETAEPPVMPASDRQAPARLAPYRDDLAQAVRAPSDKPQFDRPRLAPLVLVADQRIDPVSPAPGQPIRPRRVTPLGPGRQAAAEAAATKFAVDASYFASFAKRLGAVTAQELLEASAIYLAVVHRREVFTRPQLMTPVEALLPEGALREDCLRGFGLLLRSGRVIKLRRGLYGLAEGAEPALRGRAFAG